jgi:hypothetical protein
VLTKDELKKVTVILLLSAIHNKVSFKLLWSTNPYEATPIFAKIMSRDRFLDILSILHFSDDIETDDKFHKVRQLINMFNERFNDVYNVEPYISIDESLLLWRGNHSGQRYIPSKSDQWGFKFYVLADSKTGYTKQFLVDEGSATR